MPDITQEELNIALIEGIKRGVYIALFADGELKFYHIEHTDDDMVKQSLSPSEVEKLLLNGEVE